MMARVSVALLAAVLASCPAAAQMDHSKMNHGEAHEPEAAASDEPDHSQMDRSQHDMSPPPLPSPALAPSGPPRAADAVWGAEAMKESRDALYSEHGDMKLFWLQGDRLEYRARQGGDGYLWDAQGYYGGDINKFWLKSEGEGSFGEAAEQAEIQALYSRAIAPFFDLQLGVRQDLTGPNRTYLAAGIQGLVPYMLEVDAAAFLSNKGDLTARVEGEYDHRLTQKLIIQPRAEINLSAQDIPELRVGAGIDSAELGLRLRYQIVPEFAPYIGVEQEWKVGGSRDFAIAAGENTSATNYVIGIRFWF